MSALSLAGSSLASLSSSGPPVESYYSSSNRSSLEATLEPPLDLARPDNRVSVFNYDP